MTQEARITWDTRLQNVADLARQQDTRRSLNLAQRIDRSLKEHRAAPYAALRRLSLDEFLALPPTHEDMAPHIGSLAPSEDATSADQQEHDPAKAPLDKGQLRKLRKRRRAIFPLASARDRLIRRALGPAISEEDAWLAAYAMTYGAEIGMSVDSIRSHIAVRRRWAELLPQIDYSLWFQDEPDPQVQA